MSWKRRWGVVAVLALAQVGIVICYQGFLRGTPAPAMQPAPQKAAKADTPLPPPVVEKPTSANPALPEPPPLPGSPVDQAPKPFPETTSTPLVPVPQVPTPGKADDNPVIPAAAVQADPPAAPVKPPESPAPTEKPSSPMMDPLPTQAPPPPPSNLVPMPPPPVVAPKEESKPPLPALVPDPVETPMVQQAPVTAEPKDKPPPLKDVECPWVLRVEIVKGRTHLTAQSGKNVQFRVVCDKLRLQTPHGNIAASGNVSVASEGLEGSCESLMIAWHEDRVVLEGSAALKCQREGQEVDLRAAKLSLRLTVSGVSVSGSGMQRNTNLLQELRNVGEEADEPPLDREYRKRPE